MGRSKKGTSELGRETLFASMVRAFLERDFETIGQAMREDVVLVLPGSSPFAGVHRGAEAVGRFLLGLRQSVISDEKALSYSHEGDELIASNDSSARASTYRRDDHASQGRIRPGGEDRRGLRRT